VIVSVVVGSNLSRALTGAAPLWGTLAASTAFVALHWLLAHLMAGFPRLGALLYHGLSRQDIAVALRQKGLTSAAQTRLLVIEPNGELSVLRSD
jgi:uncharacterized membrane protein YcaP (DUF421 family)